MSGRGEKAKREKGEAGFDVFARYYDLDYQGVDEDVGFYLGFAQRCGSPILEPACGTGRVLVPLGQAGFEVTGLDVSPVMLDMAGRKLGRTLKKRVRLVEADMREFDLSERFRMAFLASDSFMHADDLEDQARTLRSVHRHLMEGGLLLVDLANPQVPSWLDQGDELRLHWLREDPRTGRSVSKLVACQMDWARQLQEVTFFYDEQGEDGTLRRTVAPFRLRYLFRYEMELLLQMTGYALEGVYGSYDLAPFNAESERMIFVAERRA
ncbi:MAG: class I SAM-dependent methyltransferase [Chloroflexota bacterium]|nr:MAG: class I SAM-dependent methyltransferase [Chloroflexota bacterium]